MPIAQLLPLHDESAVCCEPAAHDAISQLDADALARTLKALADPARVRLVSIIAAHAGQETCVCDLQVPLGLSQPTVSHHLKVLTNAGLLTRSQRGTWAYYRLVPGALDQIAKLVAGL